MEPDWPGFEYQVPTFRFVHERVWHTSTTFDSDERTDRELPEAQSPHLRPWNNEPHLMPLFWEQQV